LKKKISFPQQVSQYIVCVFKPLLSRLSPFLPALPTLVSQCAVCRSWPTSQVCTACISRFTLRIARCKTCAIALPLGLATGDVPAIEPSLLASKIDSIDSFSTGRLCASCLRQPPPTDISLVAVDYAYPWSRLIARYKFGAMPGWAAFFADLLLRSPDVQRALARLSADDFIVPMPLSAQRLQERGFNQAWELARALSKQSKSQAISHASLLLRVRHTLPQTALDRKARLLNLKGAFQVDPLLAPALIGRRVLLVDDVMTSGASMFSAAQALKAGGAAEVIAVAFARTP
jgi:ComF family protein